MWEGLGTQQHLSPCCGSGWGGLHSALWIRTGSTCVVSRSCHLMGCDGKTTSRCFVQELFSEQIGQDEAGRFWFNTVDPEVGTAGVILVSSICQLEAVCLGVERLPKINRYVGQVRLLPHLSAGPRAARMPVQAAG